MGVLGLSGKKEIKIKTAAEISLLRLFLKMVGATRFELATTRPPV